MKKEPANLPAQVESLISNLLNKENSLHVRNNYRLSLDTIRYEIEKAIAKFDKENR